MSTQSLPGSPYLLLCTLCLSYFRFPPLPSALNRELNLNEFLPKSRQYAHSNHRKASEAFGDYARVVAQIKECYCHCKDGRTSVKLMYLVANFQPAGILKRLRI